jgi:hypothetical protein
MWTTGQRRVSKSVGKRWGGARALSRQRLQSNLTEGLLAERRRGLHRLLSPGSDGDVDGGEEAGASFRQRGRWELVWVERHGSGRNGRSAGRGSKSIWSSWGGKGQ